MSGGGITELFQIETGKQDAWKVTLLGIWRCRLELALIAGVAGPYVYLSHRWEAVGTVAWVTLLGLVLCFPQAHRPLWRGLQAAHTRRKLARAIIDSGGAPRPTLRS